MKSKIFQFFKALAGKDAPGSPGKRMARDMIFCFAGGALFSASLPPFNLAPLAAFALLPLLMVLKKQTPVQAAFCGWAWGIGWTIFSFQFLREIDPIVPYLLSPVLSLWPALFAAAIPFLRDNTLELDSKNTPADRQPYFKLLIFSIGCAAWFVLVEWTRSRLFPWNDFSVPLWRIPILLQIAALTGHYGVNFSLLLINTAAAAWIVYRSRAVCFTLLGLFLFSPLYGVYKLAQTGNNERTISFAPALIQGNLSQRRHSTLPQAQEALDVYCSLTRQLLEKKEKPDLVLWPEGAVPIPFYSAHDLTRYYQNSDYGKLAASYQFQVRSIASQYGVPLLIGALDFTDPIPGEKQGSTNSALLFDARGKLQAKYDKLHRVPFGEYIPFRSLLPGFIVRYIDMGRDLTPGRNPHPIRISDSIRAGTAICYEGIFSYVMRNFARKGANVFIVLSNDAWYPRSSEPEQHLANAVLRAVETQLTMIRCGNNGGSGVILPSGRFFILDPEKKSARPELLRSQAAETVRVRLPENPERTWYVRCGEWFPLLLLGTILIWGYLAWGRFCHRKKELAERFKTN